MKTEIEEIIDSMLMHDDDIYLVDFKLLKQGNKHTVEVYLDTDEGITLDQCSAFSKKLDAEIEERELFGEDPYLIEVSSPGLSRPLTLLRQYMKALGKELNVTYNKNDENVSKILTLTKVEGSELHFSSKKEDEIINHEHIVKATYHLKW